MNFPLKRLTHHFILTMKIYATCGFLGRGAIRLEAASACQLRCPICVDVWQVKKGVGSGTLRFEDFKRFVDRHKYFHEIEISNNGEIFLNTDLDKIIAYAHKKGIQLTALNGVNLNHVKEETIKNLVKYNFKALKVSIDGATQATYEIYRVRGDLERVLENIRTINKYKSIFKSEYPQLTWQFIVFAHNEQEIPIARKMAQDLGMKFLLQRNANPEYLASGEFPTEELQEALSHSGTSFCRQLFLAPQINWDGRLLGCCINTTKNDYGNVFKSGLKECIRSERYQYALAMLKGQRDARDDIVCTGCSVYKEMQKKGTYITEFNLSSRLKKLMRSLLQRSTTSLHPNPTEKVR